MNGAKIGSKLTTITSSEGMSLTHSGCKTGDAVCSTNVLTLGHADRNPLLYKNIHPIKLSKLESNKEPHLYDSICFSMKFKRSPPLFVQIHI